MFKHNEDYAWAQIGYRGGHEKIWVKLLVQPYLCTSPVAGNKITQKLDRKIWDAAESNIISEIENSHKRLIIHDTQCEIMHEVKERIESISWTEISSKIGDCLRKEIEKKTKRKVKNKIWFMMQEKLELSHQAKDELWLTIQRELRKALKANGVELYPSLLTRYGPRQEKGDGK